MRDDNPFWEIYAGELATPNEYVTLFSPLLIEYTKPLFQVGNAVVKGIQGSGKSMLLALLDPSIRLAYIEQGVRFPLQGEMGNFIGAGVNLARCGAIDFGQRKFGGPKSKPLELYFADFINTWICLDILNSVETLGSAFSAPNALTDSNSDTLLIRIDRFDHFARSISAKDPWFSYFRGIDEYGDLKHRLKARLTEYYRYLNFNSDMLDDDVATSTTSIATPVIAFAEALWDSKVLSRSTNIFVKIDQYEELSKIEEGGDNAAEFRSVINKALALRNPAVSFRIGTRGHAWSRNLKVYGTSAVLENQRDFVITDLDEILRKTEKRPWVFPKLADDIFSRRLQSRNGPSDARSTVVTPTQVLGRPMPANEKARRYAGSARKSAIKLPTAWPSQCKRYFSELAEKDPLSAKLGEAWLKQKTRNDPSFLSRFSQAPSPEWEERAAQYWRKERVDQALVQIASRCNAAPIRSGADEVLRYSGSNVSVFLGLCRHIWAAWRRAATSDTSGATSVIPSIQHDDQTAGIDRASEQWFRKIVEESGDSYLRQKFVLFLGAMFYDTLLRDELQSNPGFTGFSMAVHELDRFPNVRTFLDDLVDHGTLFRVEHATKERDRISRFKFYIAPVLCPYLRLPHRRVKEPMYVSASRVAEWISRSQEGRPFLSPAGAAESMPDSAQARLNLEGGGKTHPREH